MIHIKNLCREPFVRFPAAVAFTEEKPAKLFLEELCADNQVDAEKLLRDIIILINGERYEADTVIRDEAKIYLMSRAMAG